MVHVEGTRSLGCRRPVEKMSGVFCDLAVEAGIPIVPVRFTGRLPVAPASERLEYRVGIGRQDRWLGAPISPEALSPLPYGERVARVRDAINALGPAEEEPSPARPELEARVRRRAEASGLGVGLSAVRELLGELDDPTAPIARLVSGDVPPTAPGSPGSRSSCPAPRAGAGSPRARAQGTRTVATGDGPSGPTARLKGPRTRPPTATLTVAVAGPSAPQGAAQRSSTR